MRTLMPLFLLFLEIFPDLLYRLLVFLSLLCQVNSLQLRHSEDGEICYEYNEHCNNEEYDHLIDDAEVIYHLKILD